MGRVRSDPAAVLDGHLVLRFGGGPDGPLTGRERRRIGLDVVVVHHAVVAGQPDRRVEEVGGGVGEVHHDPVGPAVVAGDVADVAVDGGDAVGDAVPLGVPAEVLDGDLVEVDPDSYEETNERVEEALTRVLSAGFGEAEQTSIPMAVDPDEETSEETPGRVDASGE